MLKISQSQSERFASSSEVNGPKGQNNSNNRKTFSFLPSSVKAFTGQRENQISHFLGISGSAGWHSSSSIRKCSTTWLSPPALGPHTPLRTCSQLLHCFLESASRNDCGCAWAAARVDTQTLRAIALHRDVQEVWGAADGCDKIKEVNFHILQYQHYNTIVMWNNPENKMFDNFVCLTLSDYSNTSRIRISGDHWLVVESNKDRWLVDEKRSGWVNGW